jgi:hypothetical protein
MVPYRNRYICAFVPFTRVSVLRSTFLFLLVVCPHDAHNDDSVIETSRDLDLHGLFIIIFILLLDYALS